jgi:hypothetical protein
MKTALFAATAFVALAAAGSPQAADVEIKSAVARVVVIPEDRTDVKVEIIPGRADLPQISVRKTPSGKTLIQGGLHNKIRSCSVHGVGEGVINPANPGPGVTISLSGHRVVRLADAPLITIRTPMAVRIDASEAVFGSIGRSASVELGTVGCGDWTVGNVAGELEISQAGSGDVRTGSAGATHVSMAGSGDISVGAVQSLKADIAGSGDVSAERVDGFVDASIAGAGDIKVRGGAVSRLKASIAGSGDITIKGSVGDLDASVMGSGDITVGTVTGHVSKVVMGSGDINIGR